MKNGGTTTSASRAKAKPALASRSWTLGLLAAAACQLLILWFAQYSPRDLDGKAVHYYSAARLFAGAEKVEAVKAAEPAWYRKAPGEDLAELKNSLHRYALYPVNALLIRSFCALAPGDGPPADYTYPVKLSFLLLFLLAFAWLIVVTYRHDLDAVLIVGCLLMAALNLCLPPLAPASDPDFDFLSYVPHGSATLLILAAFACFARGRAVLAFLSLLLAAGWHAGFAAIVAPCAALAFGLTLCDRAGSPSIRIMAAILMILAGVVLDRTLPDHTIDPQVWIPLFLVVLFLLIGPRDLHALWHAAASLAAFLFLTLAVGAALQQPSVRHWLIRVSGGNIEADLTARLSAIRHLVSLALPAVVIIGLLNRILPLSLSPHHRRAALLGVVTLGVAAAFVAGMPRWPQAARHMALFFHSEDPAHARQVLAPGQLPLLDPRHPIPFFSTLGDFLVTPSP